MIRLNRRQLRGLINEVMEGSPAEEAGELESLYRTLEGVHEQLLTARAMCEGEPEFQAVQGLIDEAEGSISLALEGLGEGMGDAW